MMTRLEKKLNTIACPEAIEWASSQKGSFQDAWDKCPRGDWMLWLLGRTKADHKKLVLVNCKIARTVLRYVPEDEKRPLRAIKTAEAWVKGKATLEEVKKSAYASNAAVYVAADDADAAFAAANAYAAAAYAADASYNTAYYAASYANAAYNTAKSLLNSANIIRELFPKPPRF